jgi:D-glucosaminate-6-phosphate ammonia-lyase
VPTGSRAQVSGMWNATINYTRGVGHQQFTLTQNADAVTGSQKGENYSAEFTGKVVADHVALHSVMRGSGFEVPFTFNGVLQGSTITGSVRLGEYGAATFIATKA